MIHASLPSKVVSTSLLVRRQEQVDALNNNGTTIVDWNGIKTTSEVLTSSDAGILDDADLVIISVKSYQTQSVADLLAKSATDSALVMSIQNGFGHDELLVEACGNERVLLAKTGYAGRRTDDSTVEMTATGETVFGERNGAVSERVQQIEQVFREAEVGVKVSEQMNPVLWSKFAQACSQNALSAITGKAFFELRSRESARQLLGLLSDEMKKLAAAEGVPLLFDPYVQLLKNWDGLHRRSSMLQDLEAGRRTEVDAVNGEAVRLGERHGLEMATNRAVWLLVRTMEQDNPDLVS